MSMIANKNRRTNEAVVAYLYVPDGRYVESIRSSETCSNGNLGTERVFPIIMYGFYPGRAMDLEIRAYCDTAKSGKLTAQGQMTVKAMKLCVNRA
ncbi:hypothetical protein ACS5PJ_17640 [Pseudarthrobacter sp. YS3]|uniref:hypothetical protein n=1 Tax=Pseudarthrobacter sp. YS3 TaxID=3453718 RepID=UPI003EECA5F8